MSPCSGIPLERQGLISIIFEFANIREHCSWVHSREKDAATQKAKDLIRMSVARTCKLEPLNEFDLPVDKKKHS
jgi:heterodisulfide reductase subunit A